MPESYQIDADRELVVCRAWGSLSNEDLREHYRRLAADPAFCPGYSQIADLRDVTEFTVDSATIEELAHVPVFAPGTRRAFVAPMGIAFGLARMFSTHSQSTDQVLEVFNDERGAREWLGV